MRIIILMSAGGLSEESSLGVNVLFALGSVLRTIAMKTVESRASSITCRAGERYLNHLRMQINNKRVMRPGNN